VNNDGVSEAIEIEAPYFMQSDAGSMKVAIALEDCVWTSFSNTEVEEENVYSEEDSKKFLIENKENICLGQ